MSESAHVAHFDLKGNFTQKRRYLLTVKLMKCQAQIFVGAQNSTWLPNH